MSYLEVDFSFFLLMLLVAIVYATIGHGGASGYLALMSLYGFIPAVIKPNALLLNLFVAGFSFLFYYSKQKFRWDLFLPLAFSSIPFAYLGGTLELDAIVYKKILGVFLLFSLLRIFNLIPSPKMERRNKVNWLKIVLIGGSIGFLSGLIGIGGGIILSPILLILGWANLKETAAISALFIWANSLSGIMGQFSVGVELDSSIYWMLAFVSVGGIVGAYLGSRKLSLGALRYLLAFVLFLASIKLIFV